MLLPEKRLSDEEWFARNGGWAGDVGGVNLSGEQLDEFRSIVGPLELRLGRPLAGVGLRKCLRAFAMRPAEFRRLAEDALARGSRNPVGLLVRMVEEGDHLRELPAEPWEVYTITDEERDGYDVSVIRQVKVVGSREEAKKLAATIENGYARKLEDEEGDDGGL